VDRSGHVTASGWCYVPAGRRVSDLVVLTQSDAEGQPTICGLVYPGHRREDVAALLREPARLAFGWWADSHCRPEGEIAVWVMDAEHAKLIRLRAAHGARRR